MTRFLTLLLAAAVALIGIAAPPAAADAASQKANAATIAKLVDAHNQIRAQHDLKPLKFVPHVAAQIAQPWTLKMQAAGRISHNPDFRYEGAQAWGENVGWSIGYQDPVAEIMAGFMDSPEHRDNILEPTYDLIAVGAVLSNGEFYTTVNFYQGPLIDGGTMFDSGTQWYTAVANGINATNVAQEDDVYSKDGVYALNNRLWRVACEPYSQTQRCRTEIWGTQVRTVSGRYQRVTGWAFNNLTYAPSERSLWSANLLGGFGKRGYQGEVTSAGRRWRVECDTAVSGGNGCRSYILTNVVTATPKPGGGYTFSAKPDYVFNNIVRFS